MEVDVDMDINMQNLACLCKIMSVCNKQHLSAIQWKMSFNLKLNSWKSEATLRLSWKMSCL